MRLNRNHLLMQNADDQHLVGLGKIENDVLAVLKPA
jgi:hypothetical protein